MHAALPIPYDTTHGVAYTLSNTHAMKYNAPTTINCLRAVAKAISFKNTKTYVPIENTCKKAINTVGQLSQDENIPKTSDVLDEENLNVPTTTTVIDTY